MVPMLCAHRYTQVSSYPPGSGSTSWKQEVEQRMEQLPNPVPRMASRIHPCNLDSGTNL